MHGVASPLSPIQLSQLSQALPVTVCQVSLRVACLQMAPEMDHTRLARRSHRQAERKTHFQVRPEKLLLMKLSQAPPAQGLSVCLSAFPGVQLHLQGVAQVSQADARQVYPKRCQQAMVSQPRWPYCPEYRQPRQQRVVYLPKAVECQRC